MDPLLLVNGCSCDSLNHQNAVDASYKKQPNIHKQAVSKSLNCVLSHLENITADKNKSDDERSGSVATVPSSPLKRPRLALMANASPLFPSSEATSSEDVWKAFNGFLDDDAIVATCQVRMNK